MDLRCFCGGVRVTTAGKPEFINACNCDLCRKAGAQWAYFDPADVAVSGPTGSFRRTDREEPGVDVHFCEHCACTTHFRLTETSIARHGDVGVGVNMALAEEAELRGVELRFPDGKAWSGEGAFGYVRASRVIGAQDHGRA